MLKPEHVQLVRYQFPLLEDDLVEAEPQWVVDRRRQIHVVTFGNNAFPHATPAQV
jgi:hypothetical protein